MTDFMMKLTLFSTLVLSVTIFGAFCEKARFDNYKAYRVRIENEDQLTVLQNVEENKDGYIFMSTPTHINSELQIIVPPHKLPDFEEMAFTFELNSKLITTNLQQMLDNENPKICLKEGFNWEEYQTLDEINGWIDEIAEKYSSILKVSTIGKSYEGRDMRVIVLSHKEGNPGIFIEANIHAREWITSATVTWILNELLTSEDPEVVDLAQNNDWYILPVMNVDGFEYTHTTNRLWRKSRYPHTLVCKGTDLNRNFGYKWMENGGALQNPCTELYAGPEPFFDAETKVVSDYLKTMAENIEIFLAFHSFGQYILLPYGYEKGAYPENYNDLMKIAQRAATDLEGVSGTKYTFGTTADILYIASGVSPDWVRGELDIPIAYTYEFRDKGDLGFILPADQIIPNAKEVLTSLIGLVDEAKKLGY